MAIWIGSNAAGQVCRAGSLTHCVLREPRTPIGIGFVVVLHALRDGCALGTWEPISALWAMMLRQSSEMRS